MTTIRIRLEPLDVWFFRDGRPFAAATRATSGQPTPQVLAGALRTALLEKYGCAFDRLRGRTDFAEAVAEIWPQHAWIGKVRFAGPWFACWNADKEQRPEVLVSAPASLHQGKKGEGSQLYRLRPPPCDPPGWVRSQHDDLRPLWLATRDTTEPAQGFLIGEGLRAFLRSSDSEVPYETLVKPARLYDHDLRTGIRVEADRLTAQESQIYAISFLAPRWHIGDAAHEHPFTEVGLYAEVFLPDDAPADALSGLSAVALGGEGRRARLAVLPAEFDPWPKGAVADASGSEGADKTLVLLTTPLPTGKGWARPWRPSLLDNHLVAAAVPAPLVVSGWDLARNGPKPTRFAAPAGSVYFLDGPADDLPESLADNDDAPLGWGRYLKGAWTDA
jgi:CRISPR-associated protein Cmr3